MSLLKIFLQFQRLRNLETWRADTCRQFKVYIVTNGLYNIRNITRALFLGWWVDSPTLLYLRAPMQPHWAFALTTSVFLTLYLARIVAISLRIVELAGLRKLCALYRVIYDNNLFWCLDHQPTNPGRTNDPREYFRPDRHPGGGGGGATVAKYQLRTII